MPCWWKRQRLRSDICKVLRHAELSEFVYEGIVGHAEILSFLRERAVGIPWISFAAAFEVEYVVYFRTITYAGVFGLQRMARNYVKSLKNRGYTLEV